MSISGYEVTFPIYHVRDLGNGTYLQVGDVRGTCFSLDPLHFMTAGHVVEGLTNKEGLIAAIGLTDPASGFQKTALIEQTEVLPGDIGILRAQYMFPDAKKWVRQLKWSKRNLEPFELGRSFGYAYGISDVDGKRSCVQRAFQGHVVSQLKEFKPIAFPGVAFPVYEVSFPVPRGLSGAPLLNSAGSCSVHGVLIGNSKSRMLVLSSEEIENSGNSKVVVEQYESLALGIGTEGNAVLGTASKLLGKSIGDHLHSIKLIE